MMTQTKQPKNLLFIHSILDEGGLTPNEFRLICHISRRGECYASLATIAEVTRISVRTIQKTLKSLVEKGLVLKDTKPGRTDIYRLPDHESLVEKLRAAKLLEQKKTKDKKHDSEPQKESSSDNGIRSENYAKAENHAM